ncbi:MAG: hypothetical protein P0116_11410 [Candidatus Nitrosocosmicus sp.]|nr:hypothetical protein [Candidatus Nitrosocosmicus sp.]
MLIIGQAQKKASRATCLAYSFVIFTCPSGPGDIARDQFGVGVMLWVISKVGSP